MQFFQKEFRIQERAIREDLPEIVVEAAIVGTEVTGTAADAVVIGSTLAGHLEIAAIAKGVSLSAGIAGDLLSDNPVAALGVTFVTEVTGAKAVGSVGKIAEGLAGETASATVKNRIGAAGEAIGVTVGPSIPKPGPNDK